MGKDRNEIPTYSRNMGLKYRAIFNASNQVTYEGWALDTAALTSEAKWQILAHTYDTNGNLTDSNWADKNDNFDKIWDNYASYIYS